MTTIRELHGSTKAQLVKVAEGLRPPILVKTGWTKARLVQEIRRHQNEHPPAQAGPQGKGEATKETPKEPPQQQPANPEFEEAIGKETRGGFRPGGGRPPGLTAEKAKVKNLPQFPSTPIKQGVCALFDLWASAVKVEAIALENDEADLLALPLTQLQEYYFPGLIPEIAGTFVMLIFAGTRIIKPRMELLADMRKAKAAGVDVSKIVKEENGQTGQQNHNRQDGQRKDSPSPKPDTPAQ